MGILHARVDGSERSSSPPNNRRRAYDLHGPVPRRHKVRAVRGGAPDPSSPILATTPPTVTIDAALDRGEFIVTTTSHMEKIAAVSLNVTSAGDLFTIDALPVSVHLPLELPVTVSVPVHLNLTGRYATAIVRVVSDDLGTVQVVEFTFTNANGMIRRVPQNEYAATVRAVFDDRDAAAADQRAAELIRSALARGLHPVATTGTVVIPPVGGQIVENSNFERAWNRLVAQLATP